jgi:hypothetical protein
MKNSEVAVAGVVYEEDVEEVVNRLTSILGKQGRIVYPTRWNVVNNIRVYSPKYGFIWYGDIKLRDLGLVRMFAQRLGVEMYVILENHVQPFYGEPSVNEKLQMSYAVFSATGEIVKLRCTEADIAL